MTASAFRFGTVGAPKSTAKKPGGSVGAVLRLAELGLDALELGWVQSVRVSEQTCADIRTTGENQDVLISVHAPYFFNLNADEEEWPKSRKRLMDAAYFGHLAGATDIIFHPGSYFGLPPEEVLPKAIQRLAGCMEELRLAGNPVTLRPETMGKSAMLGSLEDTLERPAAYAGCDRMTRTVELACDSYTCIAAAISPIASFSLSNASFASRRTAGKLFLSRGTFPRLLLPEKGASFAISAHAS